MCRYERIGEDDEDCGMREWDEEEKEAIRKDPDLEQHMRQLKPMRHWGPPPEPVAAAPDAGARKDIVELDKLYALPDRRKGKR
jgi:hypothetical protein